jgi:hypothetical protein
VEAPPPDRGLDQEGALLARGDVIQPIRGDRERLLQQVVDIAVGDPEVANDAAGQVHLPADQLPEPPVLLSVAHA